nr:hypothetical protein [Haloferax larsenii]
MTLVQLTLENSGRLVQFVVGVVFLFGVFPAVYVLGRLFDRVF